MSLPKRKGLLQKLGFKHHEYWSWWLLVIPIWPLWIWYGLRLRCATWFTVVNPGMEDSGFLGESKIKILDDIPDAYKPKTLFVPKLSNLTLVSEQLIQQQFTFPLIAKPDIGGRGRKVLILDSLANLQAYHHDMDEDYMLQNLIPYPIELGVFYIRIPDQEKGFVTSVAQKGFLQVQGDGQHTILQLMTKDYRASLQIDRLQKSLDLQRIPQLDEIVLLEPIGNHCRGTSFLDANHLINHQLHETFDQIAKQIPGFYYGRFDLKVKSFEDLYQGQHIQIMELNGLTADAAHIFDPNSRLRDAYSTQIKHCKLSFQIAKQHLQQGIKPTPLLELIKKSLGYFQTA